MRASRFDSKKCFYFACLGIDIFEFEIVDNYIFVSCMVARFLVEFIRSIVFKKILLRDYFLAYEEKYLCDLYLHRGGVDFYLSKIEYYSFGQVFV